MQVGYSTLEGLCVGRWCPNTTSVPFRCDPSVYFSCMVVEKNIILCILCTDSRDSNCRFCDLHEPKKQLTPGCGTCKLPCFGGILEKTANVLEPVSTSTVKVCRGCKIKTIAVHVSHQQSSHAEDMKSKPCSTAQNDPQFSPKKGKSAPFVCSAPTNPSTNASLM
jgi:hypothetical protein